MSQYPKLTIVVPCYNEEAVLHETMKQLSEVLESLIQSKLIAKDSTLLFVDDGSRDKTWQIIESASARHPFVKGIKLSRNAGHQNALLAGLTVASEHSDCVISIDADLQDDIRAIRDFMEKYWQGYDIVYGVRDSRETDTWFKRTSAQGFYWLMGKMGIQLVPNHADFRLMSKRTLEELLKYKEANLFLRGIIPLLGFPSTKVYYDRKERMAGESKYPLKKMLAFALDGITSFSITPVRFVTALGFVTFILSAFVGLYALIEELAGHTVSGWASLIISIWLLGGLELMAVGLIGEYIGKIFKEVKRRPRYTIETNLYKNEKSSFVLSQNSDTMKT
ncbi:glycosyltransferase family 2 protein [Weizmannia coagulans]|jgi:glycosyltransferase involved in cell wall biosynthesis|uniref:Glycosyl transferase family protein n=3 Tax=Heyndrickxia TaxID=2837504 RepID=A0A0C5BZ01_HEYCO|nr:MULTISPECIES: glycosyltransferase family 2 protein [Heyndrickxia]AEP00735.1 glycosyl transferase family 2 [Heyndrickxia coagulans 36D1]AJO21113.1 glycosyl transferase family protein [Heyndrickxia coagulans]AKN53248.1 Glycosyltransferase [Heyndrickxia coagulans]APB37549.1 glycosyltransferase [Heyndrickxia coagulans]ATW81775.1 glycosyltransferase [Heyndrickxia coagulans]